MRKLVIYNPESGVSISLADEVYMIDTARLSEYEMEDLKRGAITPGEAIGIGIRLDNFNMTNIFFGGR